MTQETTKLDPREIERYNGWTNYETWNVALWINTEQAMYLAAEDVVKAACDGSDYDTRGVYTREQDRRYQLTYAGEALKRWYDETFGPRRPEMVVDLWTHALERVDWLAVAESVADGMSEDPTLH